MSGRDALYAAVLAAPADDLPRLMFADWCDDHGDSDRAEFIRIQIELARLDPADPRRGPLAVREGQLLKAANHGQWRVPVGGVVQDFRRGFVEVAYTNAERFLEVAAELFASAPIRELRLSVAERWVPQLSRVAELARLDTLALTGSQLGVRDQLERLLTDAPLERLQTLAVTDARLFADAVGQIARTPVAGRLTHLDLSGNPLSDDGWEMLGGETRFRELRSLALRNVEQNYEDSAHAAGAAALAASTAYPRLQRLDLTGHHVGDAGVRSLVGSVLATPLRELRLARNDIGEIGDDWAEHVVEYLSPATRLLDLSGRRNLIGPLAAIALGDWLRLGDGLTLDLRHCDMDAKSHAVLAASPFAKGLLLDPDPPEVSA